MNKRNRLKKTKIKRVRRVAIDSITVELLRAPLERHQQRAAAFGAEVMTAGSVFSLPPDSSEPIR